MRVVERLSPPLRGVWAASLLLAAAGALAVAVDMLDDDSPPMPPVIACDFSASPTDVAPGPVAVHAKLKRFGADVVALHGSAVHVRPLFSHLMTTRDERARWLRMEVASEQEAADLAARLAADPAVEQAFVVPEVSLARNVKY